MKTSFSLLLFFIGILQLNAQRYRYLFDPYSKDSIAYADNNYEELVIPLFDPYNEIDVLQFRFQNEDLEKYRKTQLMPQLQKKWELEALKKRVQKEAIKLHLHALSFEDTDGYATTASPNYQIDEIEINALSYLGNTLTLEHRVDALLTELDADFSVIDFYYLNLETKILLNEEEFKKSISEKALQKALVSKWAKLKQQIDFKDNCMHPLVGFYPLFNQDRKSANCLPIDQWIDKQLETIVLDKIHLFWNGAVLMVQLQDVFSKDRYAPYNVQIPLQLQELKGIFLEGNPYHALEEYKGTKTSVTKFDPVTNKKAQWSLPTIDRYLDFIEISDVKVNYIDHSFKQYERADSQYIHRIYYDKGKAYKMDNRREGQQQRIDSFVWEKGELMKVMRRELDEIDSYASSDEELYVDGQLIRRVKDSRNNLKQYLILGGTLQIKHYIYLDNLVAECKFRLLHDNALNNELPLWFVCDKTGWKRDQYRVTFRKGKLIQNYLEKHIYDEKGRLKQVISDHDSYRLFQYDEKGRLSNVEEYHSTTNSTQYRYSYKGKSKIPYLMEKKGQRDKEWQQSNFYIHYD